MAGNYAFLFPGQGSQAIGMMAELSHEFPVVGNRFQEASDVLKFDLWKLVSDGPIELLSATENTQPALLAASVATWGIWGECGDHLPSILCGHSFGEYSALVCAGAINYQDAVKLVATRGKLMQESSPDGKGGMAAVIGLSKELLEDICAAVSSIGICDCANFNAPGQIVISGEKNAVAKACEQAKAAGAKRALELPVSVAAHSRLMVPAAETFMEYLSSIEIRSPEIPVVHNVDVKPHRDPAEIRSVLKQQLYSSVKWDSTIEYLVDLGYTDCYECGPGKVLTGLVKRSEASISCIPLSTGDVIESENKKATIGPK